MSAYFSGKKCSVCGVVFGEEDDVVACPVCGAPHHRECWSGQCAFHEKHGTEEQWQSNNETEETVEVEENDTPRFSESGKAVTCMRCGRINFPATDKCTYCGNPLTSNDESVPFEATIKTFPFMIDPLGGVDPFEDIGGATAGETAEFVAANTVRYIPKFSKMNRTKNVVSWNWAAFLFPGYWFLYRKCYLQGIFVLLMTVVSDILSTPFTQSVMALASSFENYQDVVTYLSTHLDAISMTEYLMYLASMAILFVIMVASGMFGDAIYKKHCINKINEIKATANAENQPTRGIIMKARKGGISFFAPIIGYSLYEVLVMLLIQFM